METTRTTTPLRAARYSSEVALRNGERPWSYQDRPETTSREEKTGTLARFWKNRKSLSTMSGAWLSASFATQGCCCGVLATLIYERNHYNMTVEVVRGVGMRSFLRWICHLMISIGRHLPKVVINYYYSLQLSPVVGGRKRCWKGGRLQPTTTISIS